MLEILQNIEFDWMALLSTLFTIFLVPIGKQIYDWLKLKKLDGYGRILYEEVVKATKSIQEVYVKDLKGTDNWDEKTKLEMKTLAKEKAIQALSSIVYRSLKEANKDFDQYLDSLIGTALYDMKNKTQNNNADK